MSISVAGSRVSLALSVLASAALIGLTGCGFSNTVVPGGDSQARMISGVVHGGQAPVQGAFIRYFATTSAGYGGTLTPIGTATTASDGTFTISVTGTCPSGQFGYLLASGGNPGLGAGTNNQALLLAAAVGPCSGINSGTIVNINEVTTIAAAYALSGFLPVGGAGITYAALQGSSAPGVTTSATNTQGLTDGFLNAANIVTVSTGSANAAPLANTGIVPQATINSLGDILQDCVNSASGASTACTNLFAAAKPPTGTGIAAPANTLQAAIDIAQYPGANPSGLFSLISSQAAFQPTVAAAPNDWTIGVTYTYSASLLKSGLGLGIDNYDNVYVTGSTGASTGTDLLVMSPQGTLLNSALMSSVATSNNIRWIAFDKNNTAYMTDGASFNGIYQFVPTTPANPSAGGTLNSLSDSTATGTTNTNTYALAVDKTGDVWTMGYKKSTCQGSAGGTLGCFVVEFPAPVSATSTVTANTFAGSTQDVQPGISGSVGYGARGIAYDVNRNNLWTTEIGFSYLQLFNPTSGLHPATWFLAAPRSPTARWAMDR